jgi:hypothetical protein
MMMAPYAIPVIACGRQSEVGLDAAVVAGTVTVDVMIFSSPDAFILRLVGKLE